MWIKKSVRTILLPAAFIALMLTACDRNRNHPGWDYFPDMFYSKAYESYTPNTNTGNGSTMLGPVEGTVSREFDVFTYGPDEAERIRAGEELTNPLPSSPAVLERGKTVYSRYCLMCHGETGAGDGFLNTSGRYPVKPRPLIGEAGEKLKDGEIYHTISLGFGSMGAHGAQIQPTDRWAAVSYIRLSLQPRYKTTQSAPQQ